MSLFGRIPRRDAGFFNVYVQDGRYYLEVPEGMLQRDILVAVTIVREPPGKSGAGMPVSGMAVIRCLTG